MQEVASYVESQSAVSTRPSASAVAVDTQDEEETLCSAMWTPDEEMIDTEAWMIAHAERQVVEDRSSLRSVLCFAAMVVVTASLFYILKEQVWQALAGLDAVQGSGHAP